MVDCGAILLPLQDEYLEDLGKEIRCITYAQEKCSPIVHCSICYLYHMSKIKKRIILTYIAAREAILKFYFLNLDLFRIKPC